MKLENDEAIEADDLRRELQTYIEEAVVDFVRNGVTDQKWDAFQKTTKAIGSDHYIELFQNGYDAYLARMQEAAESESK